MEVYGRCDLASTRTWDRRTEATDCPGALYPAMALILNISCRSVLTRWVTPWFCIGSKKQVHQVVDP